MVWFLLSIQVYEASRKFLSSNGHGLMSWWTSIDPTILHVRFPEHLVSAKLAKKYKINAWLFSSVPFYLLNTNTLQEDKSSILPDMAGCCDVQGWTQQSCMIVFLNMSRRQSFAKIKRCRYNVRSLVFLFPIYLQCNHILLLDMT